MDSGPLVALINRRDAYHKRCLQTIQHLPRQPLVTSWACFTEAMHFLGDAAGYEGQRSLWSWRRTGKLVIQEITEEMGNRMEALMTQYCDAPMDLADASLVAIGEALSVSSVFTLDSHFRAYLLNGKTPFEVFP